MSPILIALVVLAVSGIAALLTCRSYRVATTLAVSGVVIAAIAGLQAAIHALLTGGTQDLRLPWNVPYGEFHVAVDPLSAFFLIIVFVLSVCAAVYGAEYMSAYRATRAAGASWFFFNLLIASLILVVVARNAMLFLVAWEVMSLSSFFLVTFDDEELSVRRAGWTYLIATHIGVVFLMAFFILLGQDAGGFDFASFTEVGARPANAGILFGLALVGFGLKAGFMPAHVWLPEAHPAAPSHVSAIMSGVMIKMGLYGLIRSLSFLGTPAPWWGWLLVAIGFVSGVMGILLASAQHDMKRLLAYSSVENMGLAALALGIGVTGLSAGSPAVIALGFGGCLLHVLNHSLYKSLLFFGAGAIQHGTGTRNLNVLGGLLKRMPWTGACCLVGAIAICGLPPLNGFVSEFLMFLGAMHGFMTLHDGNLVAMILAAMALPVIGGLAVVCFTKLFGAAFLGEPRSPEAARAHEVGPASRTVLVVLVVLCLLVVLNAPQTVGVALAVAASAFAQHADLMADAGVQAISLVLSVLLGIVALLALIGTLALARYVLLSRRTVASGVTWDCGYAAPTARMQYTASSFAQPVTDFFAQLLRPVRRSTKPEGLFPRLALLKTDTEDPFHHGIFRPVFGLVTRSLSRFRWLQHGMVHWYVLYIAITLLALLIWSLQR